MTPCAAPLHAVPPIASITEPYRFTARGLVVSRYLTPAEFEAIGRRLANIANGWQWALGDWLVYGQDAGLPGAKYSRAADLTGLSYDVLSQAVRVASAYDIDERVPALSWTHHRAALPLPELERLPVLERAAAERWTAAMVLAFVAERHRAIAAGLPLSQTPMPEREAPHVRRFDTWRPYRARRRRFRMCPQCGYRWEARTTDEKAG